jgi:Trk K+ transport system NAD-binding subunit
MRRNFSHTTPGDGLTSTVLEKARVALIDAVMATRTSGDQAAVVSATPP